MRVTNSGSIPITLTNLNITASDSGNDPAGLSSVRVYIDTNNNGQLDGGDSFQGTGNYSSDDGTISFTINNSVLAGGSVNYLVVDNFSTTAPDGRYVANINTGGISGTSADGPINVMGLPVSGAVITIAHATATFTSTAIPTATATPTQTASPQISTVLVYPNPSDGKRPVRLGIPGRTANSIITVQIFTTAFRLVQQKEFSQVPLGTDIQIELIDKTGKPLASGLYYVVVRVNDNRMVGKLLLLR